MAHQIREDVDGVEDPDCADVPNVQPETVTATSAILRDTLKKYAAKIAQEESTTDSHCTGMKMTKMTKMKMKLRQYTVSKRCTT